MGRLPNNMASWLSKLLDLNIIFLTGTVIDCPKPLRTGSNVVLCLKVYMLPAAFQSSVLMPGIGPSGDNPDKLRWHEEGRETHDEQALRERKVSLLRLFDTVNMRPIRSSRDRRRTQVVLSSLDGSSASTASESRSHQGKAREIIGDDEDAEEIEVEGEELTDQQVTNIYTK